jgi:effector-binding domain-containing protein
MSIEPTVIDRAAQPYVAVRESVTMQTFGVIADRLPEVIGRLVAQGIEIAGAPFFRYTVIDMDARLEVEAGVPVATELAGEGDIFAGVLPAGRYVTVTHVGHPDELVDVTGKLLDWAAGQGLTWDMTGSDAGERWGCRLEILKTDPRVEPDMTKWETELAFRLTT